MINAQIKDLILDILSRAPDPPPADLRDYRWLQAADDAIDGVIPETGERVPLNAYLAVTPFKWRVGWSVRHRIVFFRTGH